MTATQNAPVPASHTAAGAGGQAGDRRGSSPPAPGPPATSEATVLEGFAGAGGLSEGCRMLGLDQTLGIEINADACATAQAAGHSRTQADIRTLDPDDFPNAQGWISGPPCPTFADSGLRTGRADYQAILDAVETVSDNPKPRALLADIAAQIRDPRTALVLETLEVALAIPSLRWLVAEQVPAVRRIWEEFAAELCAHHRWEHCHIVTMRADDLGAATRRTRVFLIATRDRTPDLDGLPTRAHWTCGRFDEGPREHAPHRWTPFPATSMAEALGWPPGITINTRGNRRTPGGNLFSADGPAQSLTGNGARSWWRTDLGPQAGKLHDWQAGVLQGFPADYPWRGSRTSRFQRIADSVSPLVAAAVIGTATGRDWRPAVADRLAQIYDPSTREAAA